MTEAAITIHRILPSNQFEATAFIYRNAWGTHRTSYYRRWPSLWRFQENPFNRCHRWGDRILFLLLFLIHDEQCFSRGGLPFFCRHFVIASIKPPCSFSSTDLARKWHLLKKFLTPFYLGGISSCLSHGSPIYRGSAFFAIWRIFRIFSAFSSSPPPNQEGP